MAKLVLLGLTAAFFFSSTFVLNRAMNVGGGHWYWAGALRYGFMLLFLFGIVRVKDGAQAVTAVLACYRTHWRFWTLAGGIGFGFFYAALCYASTSAPGWVVATTWQLNILATPIALAAFGRRVPLKGIMLLLVVFVGILLVNLSQVASGAPRGELLAGIGAVIIAAFAYPFGNTLVGEAKHGTHARVPHITGAPIESALSRVLLMSLGSVPFWILLGCIVTLAGNLPVPTARQWWSTAFVALSTGVIATSIYFIARHRARTPYEIAAVDASKAAEVPFALAIEMAFLHTAAPQPLAFLGILVFLGGIVAFTLRRTVKE